jgi:hypothetical protein
MNLVFTHRKKGDAISVIKDLVHFIRTQYHQTIRFLRTDDEQTLGNENQDLIKRQGLVAERSAPYSP